MISVIMILRLETKILKLISCSLADTRHRITQSGLRWDFVCETLRM